MDGRRCEIAGWVEWKDDENVYILKLCLVFWSFQLIALITNGIARINPCSLDDLVVLQSICILPLYHLKYIQHILFGMLQGYNVCALILPRK